MISISGVELFRGKPIEIPNLCLVYAPTLNDICKIGELEYFKMVRLMTYDFIDVDIEVERLGIKEKLTVFDFFCKVLCASPWGWAYIQKAFQIFTKQQLIYDSETNSLFLKSNKIEKLTEEIFVTLQQVIAKQNLVEYELPPPEVSDPKMKRFYEKTLLGKKTKRKSKSGTKEESADDTTSFIKNAVSSLVLETGIFGKDLWDMSYYALMDLYDRLHAKIQYDGDTQAIMAGGDSKKIKPKIWTMSLNRDE